MRPAAELIASCITLSSLSTERRMLLTTMLVVTTPLERRLLILSLIVSESWLILALGFKDSFSSTLLVVAPDLDLLPFLWSVCPLTTARSPSLNLPSTQLPRLLLLLWSLTMLSSPPIPLLSIPIVLSWLIMRLFMTSAAEISTLKDHPTPILTE